MKAILLTLVVLAGAYVYVLIETENRKNIQSPTQQKRTSKKRKQRRRKRDEHTALAYATNSNVMAIAKESGTLAIWYSHSGSELFLLQKTGFPIVFLMFSEDESWLLALDNRGITQLWNIDTGEISRTLVELSEKGFPNKLKEFVEVNPIYDCLVFRQSGKLVYYNYLTEELFDEPPVPLVSY